LAVKINGNCGAQQEISVSTKVLKEIVPFQQKFPTWECDVKNNPIGRLESDKKFRLRLHPKTTGSGSATLIVTMLLVRLHPRYPIVYLYLLMARAVLC